jgi:hypothetical protein
MVLNGVLKIIQRRDEAIHVPDDLEAEIPNRQGVNNFLINKDLLCYNVNDFLTVLILYCLFS